MSEVTKSLKTVKRMLTVGNNMADELERIATDGWKSDDLRWDLLTEWDALVEDSEDEKRI